jgi:hypothetical protein
MRSRRTDQERTGNQHAANKRAGNDTHLIDSGACANQMRALIRGPPNQAPEQSEGRTASERLAWTGSSREIPPSSGCVSRIFDHPSFASDISTLAFNVCEPCSIRGRIHSTASWGRTSVIHVKRHPPAVVGSTCMEAL